MEANCKRLLETIARQQESHDVTEPIGPLFLHYQGISGLLKTQRPYIQYAFEKGCSPMNNRKLSSNIYASTEMKIMMMMKVIVCETNKIK